MMKARVNIIRSTRPRYDNQNRKATSSDLVMIDRGFLMIFDTGDCGSNSKISAHLSEADVCYSIL
jgi:hypothetical protein